MVIKTPIHGLEMVLNKVIKDKRGALCEMVPAGTKNESMKNGIGNIYASIALDRQPRAGHYHFKNVENFYVVYGTALWAFVDYRKESPTFGKTYAIIIGYEGVKEPKGIEQHTIERNEMAQIIVPTGVYHVYIPLTERPAIVVAIASVPHSNEDYVRINPDDIPQVKEIFSRFSENNT